MEAKLVVVGGKANMGEVKLRLPMTIGRGSKADLIISHPTVSRIHCKLSEVDGLLVIRDNSSSNGTFVDNQQITESVVRPGQQLKIGPITFRAEYEIAEVLPPPALDDAGPAMAETQSIDRDNFDFLADDMFADVEEKEEKTAPAAKFPEKAKPKAKEQPAAPKTTPLASPAKPAKQTPPSPPAEETAVFTPGADVGFEETTADKGDSMFDEVEEPSTPSATAPTVEVPAEPAGKSSAMDFDFLSELNFDDAAAEEPPAAPSPPEASAVAPAVEEPEPTAEPEATAAAPEKVSADDFDFLSDLEPEAAVEPPAAKAEEPKFFEPKPIEPAVTTDFTGDLGLGETKPFHMPHIPAAEESIAPPAAAEEPEKIAAADFDFLSELEPQSVAETPVVEPPSQPVEPEAAAPEMAEPEVAEPEVVEPEAIAPSEPVEEPVVNKTASTEELDLVFDFDDATTPAEATPEPVAELPPGDEPFAGVPEVPAAEAPQWPEVAETPVAEMPAAEASAAEEPGFDFNFEEELTASAPPESIPFTPDAEAPTPEPEIVAEWSPPAEVAEPAAPQPADAFDFLADEPGATAAAPAVEADVPEVAEEKFFEPKPTEPAVVFDFTGDVGLAETQHFVMPKETADENPPPFTFEPAAFESTTEPAPSEEPEAPAFAPQAESPFAASPVGKAPLSKPTTTAQPAAAKLSFVDKIKMLLGLGGAKKKSPASKKGKSAGGLEATAAAAAAPIEVPKFGSRVVEESSIPLADDAPIPLFGEEPQSEEPATPIAEAPQMEAAPQIDAAPPKDAANSLFDELALMEGAPSADPLGPKFSEPAPTKPAAAFDFTGDLGIAETKPFALPHTHEESAPSPLAEAAAADMASAANADVFDDFLAEFSAAAEAVEPPPAETPAVEPVAEVSAPAVDPIDELFGFDEPPTPEAAAETPPPEPMPALEAPAATPAEDFFGAFAETETAPSTPVAEPLSAEVAPINEAADEAKAELEDLFASFTGAEPEAAVAPESTEAAPIEPVTEAPPIEVTPPAGEANSLLDELAMMEGAPSADPLGPKFSEPAPTARAAALDFTGDLGISETKPFALPHTHEESAPSPLAEAAAAEIAEPAPRDESPFDELFAPGDEPELATADPVASTPVDVTTNFVPQAELQPEPTSPPTWEEPAPFAQEEVGATPISAELAAPMPSVVEETTTPVESVAVGATRPYVIDIDVRHTYLNRLAVRIAAKMSKLDIPDLEPELPAGRTFNRIGRPPAPTQAVESPAAEESPLAVAGEAVFVTSAAAAEVPAAFDSWETPAADLGIAESPQAPSEPPAAEFDASSLFGEEPPVAQESAPPPAVADFQFDAESLFAEETPIEAAADAAPPSTEGLTELFQMPTEEPPASETAATADDAKAKPATPPAEPKGKDDDLDAFLNDLGMG